jgi:galactokinase
VLDTIAAAFKARFGQQADHIVSAPGRVNLIGDHTDYNDGFVLPAAIDRHTVVAAHPRSDRQIVVVSAREPETATLDLHDPPSPAKRWTDYVFGVALMLEASGHTLRGANLYIDGDIPIGAGLSSSASLSTAVALALLGLAGRTVDPTSLARICQQAENEFVGTRCGIMDPFVILHAQKDHALFLDCRTLGFRELPLFPDARLVICNSRVHHELAAGEYNRRREQCEAGVAVLQAERDSIQALRDVTVTDLEEHAGEIDEATLRRCRHVVTENLRVEEAAMALEAGDAAAFGHLMWASHRSLQEDFEVSCRELDVLVEAAMTVSGVYGARMTGGGFGGCTVNLVEASAVDNFCRTIVREYEDLTGLKAEVYVSQAVGGAAPLPS